MEILRQVLVATDLRQLVTLVIVGLSAIILWSTRKYPWVNVAVATVASTIIVGFSSDWGAALLFGGSSACFLSALALRQPTEALVPGKPEQKCTDKRFEYDDSEVRVVHLG